MLPVTIRPYLICASSVPMILIGVFPQRSASPPVKAPGEALFAKVCAPCHGVNGAGGAAFPRPLTGSKSVAELGKFISQSMPPGPKKTPLPQAQQIAAFMVDAFYSPLAQERNRPAKVSLARLTVKQFKNSIADLIGDYHSVVPGTPGGLRGEYFKNRERSQKNRVIERVDPEVKFDFGTVGPAAGQVEPHNYTITWSGSIFAPDSGEYELVIQTDHSARLYVNGGKKPLIDAWVKSGTDTEYRAYQPLIGGRAYPIYLEFSKATYGVNDDAKKKDIAPSSAFVRLMWKRPKSALEPIPSQFLFPAGIAPTYIASSPFPADDRSIGYERGNTVDKAWDDATTVAALEAAETIAKNLETIARVPANAPDRTEKLKSFARSFIARAFRRPLTKEVEQTYIEKQFLGASSPEIAVQRIVILTLKSPRFLYREIGNRADPYAIASELSFGMWDTLPDPELLRAAGAGELANTDGVRRQATRLSNDTRAWTKLRDFLLLWLKVDEIPDIVKNQKRFPGFDESVITDLRTSLDLYLLNTAWSKDADFRQLMLNNTQYLNGRLSKFYGGKLAADAPFQASKSLDRTGVLTHPYLLSRYAYLEGSSPIHRGVLVTRSMLGRLLAPPPSAFAPLAANLHPSLTTRQRVELQTKPDMCNACHSLVNPLGFPFEKYDAIGRVRSEDNGKPVDTSGSYQTRAGTLVKFKDAGELAEFLATSEESQSAFAEKLFQHMTKQPVRAYGAKTLPNLQDSFKKDNYNIRSLMVSIMMATLPSSAQPK